jgi:DNA-binding transcriptional ArsR family regulator
MNPFEALADPTRRQIVEMVARRELSAGEIAAAFDVTRPAVSRHLRVLRESGLLTSRGDRQRRLYRIDPTALDEMERWISRTRRFWTNRLDALERQLQEDGG